MVSSVKWLLDDTRLILPDEAPEHSPSPPCFWSFQAPRLPLFRISHMSDFSPSRLLFSRPWPQHHDENCLAFQGSSKMSGTEKLELLCVCHLWGPLIRAQLTAPPVWELRRLGWGKGEACTGFPDFRPKRCPELRGLVTVAERSRLHRERQVGEPRAVCEVSVGSNSSLPSQSTYQPMCLWELLSLSRPGAKPQSPW